MVSEKEVGKKIRCGKMGEKINYYLNVMKNKWM
jgi:hypothetical protein